MNCPYCGSPEYSGSLEPVPSVIRWGCGTFGRRDDPKRGHRSDLCYVWQELAEMTAERDEWKREAESLGWTQATPLAILGASIK